MALTATTSLNIALRETYDHRLHVPIVAGTVINQGDLVMWDATLNAGNGAARTPVTQADMATFLGFAAQQSPVASIGDSYTYLEIFRGGIVRAKTTAAEVYKHFTKVFFNETLDVQTIVASTNTGARTVAVGYALMADQDMMNGITTKTGAAGVDIDVWITPNFPVATI